LAVVRIADTSEPDSLRKGVSDALQLAEIGDPRRPRQSGNAGVDLESWESFGGEVRQLPLEAPDLAPQLGPRQPLVAADSKFV
jgi:hypothetical protein